MCCADQGDAISLLSQLPVADGVVQGRRLGVRVQWTQQQADKDAADTPDGSAPGPTAVFEVGTRVWKEDAGPIPPRVHVFHGQQLASSSSAAQVLFCFMRRHL